MPKMKIIPYSKQFIDKKDIESVAKALRSSWLTRGPKVDEFERVLSSYCGAKYAVAVSSGTAALHLACLASGLKRGDEAITSPITFLATPNSILYSKAKPVFADINLRTSNINPEEIEKKLTKRTKAILPVHYAGLPCEANQIYKLAKKYNLTLIEDACHALGAQYKYNEKWYKVGSCKHSDMAVFSFHPLKSITTGEGGAILTNSRKYYEILMMLRQHGVTRNGLRSNGKHKLEWYYEMHQLGYNYRLTDIQCALGISQLKKLDRFICRRKDIAQIYNQAFKDNDFFNLPVEIEGLKSSWHLYTIKLNDKYKRKKKLLFHRLREKKLWIQVHYIPVYLQPYYQQLGYGQTKCPNAEDLYQRAISIPIFPSMTQNDINYTIKTIFSVFKEI